MIRLILIALLLSGSLLAMFLSGSHLSPAPTCTITLIPNNDTFNSWLLDRPDTNGFVSSITVEHVGVDKGKMEFAVCSSSHPEQHRRFGKADSDYLLPDLTRVPVGGTYGGGIYFYKNGSLPVSEMGEGTFLIAILIDGVRCSNVIHVTIQHDYDATKEPPLRVFATQPLTGNLITRLNVWIVPPKLDPKLTNIAASDAELAVDGGNWRTPRPGTTCGPVYPLQPGMPFMSTCLLDFYNPSIPSFRHAKVQARLLDFTSKETEISYDPTDAKLFDKAFGL